MLCYGGGGGLSMEVRARLSRTAQALATLHGAQGGGKPTGGFHKKRLVGTLQYMPPEVLLKVRRSCLLRASHGRSV